jgi:hypothetical protein
MGETSNYGRFNEDAGNIGAECGSSQQRVDPLRDLMERMKEDPELAQRVRRNLESVVEVDIVEDQRTEVDDGQQG